MSEVSLIPALAELERLSRELEKVWCAPQKCRPVITIQSGRGRACGWFLTNSWQRKGRDTRLPEVNIAAEHLKTSGKEICHTLLHELVHWHNWLRGELDTSSNDYHNRRFRRACHDVGLICEYEAGVGWALTRPTPELDALFDQLAINEEAFQIFRRSPDFQRSAPVRKRIVYACACPPVNTVQRAMGSRLHALCTKCGQMFVAQE